MARNKVMYILYHDNPLPFWFRASIDETLKQAVRSGMIERYEYHTGRADPQKEKVEWVLGALKEEYQPGGKIDGTTATKDQAGPAGPDKPAKQRHAVGDDEGKT